MKIQFHDYSLRQFQDSDVESLARHANNRKIWKNLRDGFPYPYSVDDARGWINITKESEEGSSLAICHKDQVIGSIGITLGADVHFRTAELGYWLGEDFWGRGIMQNAVRLYVDYAFEKFDLLRIFAEPFAHNIASCRLLEKAGFELEGVLKKNAVKDNAVLDMMMYARTKSEQGEVSNG